MPVMSIQGIASLAFTTSATLSRRPKRIIIAEVRLEPRVALVGMDRRIIQVRQENRTALVRLDERIVRVTGRPRASRDAVNRTG